MTHLTDDDLVLYYYAEGEALPASRAHLESCAVCGERLSELERAMGAVTSSRIPERDESYGRLVWARVQTKLSEPERAPRWRALEWLTLPRLAYAGGLAVLLIAAFVAGRNWPMPAGPSPAPATESASAPVDTKAILSASAAAHLERSAMVLAEVANEPATGSPDTSDEQMRAGDLVASGRLMRQVAARTGDSGHADLLDQLERVLLEITNSPSPMPAATLDAIRSRIKSEDLLFKVRVLESQMRARHHEQPAAQANTKKS